LRRHPFDKFETGVGVLPFTADTNKQVYILLVRNFFTTKCFSFFLIARASLLNFVPSFDYLYNRDWVRTPSAAFTLIALDAADPIYAHRSRFVTLVRSVAVAIIRVTQLGMRRAK
jgi:hypothetical protein